MTAVEVNRLQVRRHFDAHAVDYDRYAVVQKRVVNRLVALSSPLLSTAGTVLEIGTGTGMLARQLQQPGRTLVISDLAHGMTRHARQNLDRPGAVDADAAALPFAGASFTAVASSSVYQWIEDLAGAFTEVARVLQPGGWFAFALFGESSLWELKRSHRQALHDCGLQRSSHAQEFPGLEEVSDALLKAGFDGRELFAEEEVDLHADVPSLLRALKKIGAGNASRHRPPGLAPRRVMQRMMAIYKEEHGVAGGIPSTYEVIYGAVRKPV